MQIRGGAFLITGGASGLGAACARRLVEAGGAVALLDLNAAAGEALCEALGERARFFEVDVRDEASVMGAIEAAEADLGPISGLISCAGVAPGEKTVGRGGQPHALEAFQRTIEINLIGAFNVARLAAAAMARKDAEGERGVIINTASVAAFEGQIGQAAYAASKGGVVGMTLPMARDLAKLRIRVCAIAPGIFDTPMLAGLPESVRDALGQMVPNPPRLGRPEEFAALAQHIIENEMLNGEVIRLDGAIRMQPR